MTHKQKLTPYTISRIRKPGRHTDGEGLALLVAKDGSRRWVLRYRAPADRRVRDMGLGPLRTVDLFAAREKADAARRLIARGIDPLEVQDGAIAATTVAAVLDDLVRTVSPDLARQEQRNPVAGLDRQALRPATGPRRRRRDRRACLPDARADLA